MRKLRRDWVSILLAVIAASILTQQVSLRELYAQAEPGNAPVPTDTVPQLSEQDRSLACPAKKDPYADAEKLYKVGRGVQPPILTNQVAASFSEEARKKFKREHLKNFSALSLVNLVVDTSGNPQSICVKKPAGLGLDGQAVLAVQQYRFEPATKEGVPVPVRITVEVDFKMF